MTKYNDEKWKAFFKVLDTYEFTVYDILSAIAAQLSNQKENEFSAVLEVDNNLFHFNITKGKVQ